MDFVVTLSLFQDDLKSFKVCKYYPAYVTGYRYLVCFVVESRNKFTGKIVLFRKRLQNIYKKMKDLSSHNILWKARCPESVIAPLRNTNRKQLVMADAGAVFITAAVAFIIVTRDDHDSFMLEIWTNFYWWMNTWMQKWYDYGNIRNRGNLDEETRKTSYIKPETNFKGLYYIYKKTHV